MHRDELLADDVPLGFRVRDAFQSLQKFRFSFLDTKRRCAKLLKQAPHVGGLAFAHQPGIDVDAEDTLGARAPAGTAYRPPWSPRRR